MGRGPIALKGTSNRLNKVESSVFSDNTAHLVLLLPFTTVSLGVLPLCVGTSVTQWHFLSHDPRFHHLHIMNDLSDTQIIPINLRWVAMMALLLVMAGFILAMELDLRSFERLITSMANWLDVFFRLTPTTPTSIKIELPRGLEENQQQRRRRRQRKQMRYHLTDQSNTIRGRSLGRGNITRSLSVHIDQRKHQPTSGLNELKDTLLIDKTQHGNESFSKVASISHIAQETCLYFNRTLKSAIHRSVSVDQMSRRQNINININGNINSGNSSNSNSQYSLGSQDINSSMDLFDTVMDGDEDYSDSDNNHNNTASGGAFLWTWQLRTRQIATLASSSASVSSSSSSSSVTSTRAGQATTTTPWTTVCTLGSDEDFFSHHGVITMNEQHCNELMVAEELPGEKWILRFNSSDLGLLASIWGEIILALLGIAPPPDDRVLWSFVVSK
ncbi:hypothetical protein BDF19DRAFT_448530 [Syncephalis fuscata]|nr:hypothetical protein BDF19DRAFT_448530 [Syncephalis fuscata]